MTDVVHFQCDRDRFDGVMVIGDVHGRRGLLESLLVEARARRLFAVLLGDLVNNGPDSVGVMRHMRALMAQGCGMFLRGNHEERLYRYLVDSPPPLDETAATTARALARTPGGDMIARWFIDAYDFAPFVLHMGRLTLVHAALHPEMEEYGEWLPKSMRRRAIYGELDFPPSGVGKAERIYDWTACIPAGRTVVIGHHPLRRDAILVRRNEAGGKLIHLDTGAGKGGPLSALIAGHDGKVRKIIAVRPDSDDLLPRPMEMTPAEAEAAPPQFAEAASRA